MKTDVTVVVGTFDKYRTAWPTMCHGLRKYWADCPWPIVFIADEREAPAFSTIKVGRPEGWHRPEYWSERIRAGLHRLTTSVILWTSEDNWLTAPPDTEALQDFAEHIVRGRADYIRLYPGWDHDRPAGSCPYDSRLLPFAIESPYRCSLKPALWSRRVFKRILRTGETPWDFERNASRRSRKHRSRFLAVKDWGHYFPMVTRGDPTGPWVKSPIVKGRWTKAAKRYAEREGLEIDFSRHPMEKILDDKLRKVDWLL